MRIMNDIACNLNWIQIPEFNSYFSEIIWTLFNWISLNTIQIQLKKNEMIFWVKGIQNLLNMNMLFRKRKTLEKTQIQKIFSFPFIWELTKVWSLKVYNKIIYNVRKTTSEPWVWS